MCIRFFKKDNSNVNPEKCCHDFYKFKNAQGSNPSLVECKKCKTWLTVSEAAQLKSLKYTRASIFISTFAIFISILSPYLFQFYQQKLSLESNISLIYRTLIVNEDIFIGNINAIEKLNKSDAIENIPLPLVEYTIDNRARESLQKNLGISAYQIFLFNTSQINLLNVARQKMIDSFLNYGSSSVEYKMAKKSYLDLMSYLNLTGRNTKMNFADDSECIVDFFHKAFSYLSINTRDKNIRCKDESLDRMNWHFGFLQAETPIWLREMLKVVQGR